MHKHAYLFPLLLQLLTVSRLDMSNWLVTSLAGYARGKRSKPRCCLTFFVVVTFSNFSNNSTKMAIKSDTIVHLLLQPSCGTVRQVTKIERCWTAQWTGHKTWHQNQRAWHRQQIHLTALCNLLTSSGDILRFVTLTAVVAAEKYCPSVSLGLSGSGVVCFTQVCQKLK